MMNTLEPICGNYGCCPKWGGSVLSRWGQCPKWTLPLFGCVAILYYFLWTSLCIGGWCGTIVEKIQNPLFSLLAPLPARSDEVWTIHDVQIGHSYKEPELGCLVCDLGPFFLSQFNAVVNLDFRFISLFQNGIRGRFGLFSIIRESRQLIDNGMAEKHSDWEGGRSSIISIFNGRDDRESSWKSVVNFASICGTVFWQHINRQQFWAYPWSSNNWKFYDSDCFGAQIGSVRSFLSFNPHFFSGLAQGPSEPSNGGGRNSGDDIRIENISNIPEDDIQKVMRGATLFAILICFAYLVGRRCV